MHELGKEQQKILRVSAIFIAIDRMCWQWAGLVMRIRPRYFIVAGVLCVFALVMSLNFTGFCYADLRYYSEQEFLNTAVQASFKWHDPSEPQTKTYNSLDEFYKENPNCCLLHRWGHEFVSDLRLLGFYTAVADIWYRAEKSGPEPFYLSYVSMNACSQVVKRRGIAKAYARPDWMKQGR
jgi:hypothetical protein